MQTILVTGSKGLVGRELCKLLKNNSYAVVEFDIAAQGDDCGDIRILESILPRIKQVDGVVHLAAVSRVVWGERNPSLCKETNEGGMFNLISAIERLKNPPWVLFASSREVYGNQPSPVTEDCAYRPQSIYGETKVAAEKMILNAKHQGINAGIARLSNVYGSYIDYSDRVVPAFVRAAITGAPLNVEGACSRYDFTHVSDAVKGIYQYMLRLAGRQDLPPIHLTTGVSTSLEDLARTVVITLKTSSQIRFSGARHYGSQVFYGDNRAARSYLSWSPSVRLVDGILDLAFDFVRP